MTKQISLLILTIGLIKFELTNCGQFFSTEKSSLLTKTFFGPKWFRKLNRREVVTENISSEPLSSQTPTFIFSSPSSINNDASDQNIEKLMTTESPTTCITTSTKGPEFIEDVKKHLAQELLDRLGMNNVTEISKPNLSSKERQEIEELYEKSLEEVQKNTGNSLFMENKDVVNQFHSFSDNGSRPENLKKWSLSMGDSKNSKKVYFPLEMPDLVNSRKNIIVNSATLKLYKNYVNPEKVISTDLVDKSIQISIFQTVIERENQINNDNSQTSPHLKLKTLKKLVTFRLISLEKVGWEDFDVTKAVQNWLDDPPSNLGLEISCDKKYNIDELVGFVLFENSSEVNSHIFPNSAQNIKLDVIQSLPTLNVLTQESQIQERSISKRSLLLDSPLNSNLLNPVVEGPDDCTINGKEKRCCRYPMYINFKDLGWDNWIIKPEGYNAYYCMGSCPIGYKPANKYASVLSFLSGLNINNLPEKGSLTLKCVAAELKPLNIAHLNLQRIPVVSVIQNMIPERCHCQ